MINDILVIQKFFRKNLIIYNNLQYIKYNKSIIDYYSINSFIVSRKNKNYANNYIRENIIGAIINEKIPDEYYKFSNRWKRMRFKIISYMHEIYRKKENKNNNYIYKIVCNHKGGRKNYYDFKIIINDDIEFNIEFKFNASDIRDAPQFISPMKPSQYLTNSYEDYFYEKYLKKLSKIHNINLPDKDEYLLKIHAISPDCMKEYQYKYYSGCKSSSRFSGKIDDIKFYEDFKKMSKESITTFIKENDLLIEKLSEYLQKSQKNKYYMLYKNDTFHLSQTDINDYKLKSFHKEARKSSYIAITEKNKKIKILLRWKNGNGISYPSFQISS